MRLRVQLFLKADPVYGRGGADALAMVAEGLASVSLGEPQESRPRLPCRYGTTPKHRILVELVEADIEIGFRLVDMLESWSGEPSRLVAAIEDDYAGVLARIDRLQPLERENFAPLVTELRRAIDLAVPPSAPGD